LLREKTILDADAIFEDPIEQMLLDNLSTAVLLVNDALIITYLNAAAESLLAVSANRVCGSSAEIFFAGSDLHMATLRKALQTGRPFTERKVSIFLPDQNQIIVD